MPPKSARLTTARRSRGSSANKAASQKPKNDSAADKKKEAAKKQAVSDKIKLEKQQDFRHRFRKGRNGSKYASDFAEKAMNYLMDLALKNPTLFNISPHSRDYFETADGKQRLQQAETECAEAMAESPLSMFVPSKTRRAVLPAYRLLDREDVINITQGSIPKRFKDLIFPNGDDKQPANEAYVTVLGVLLDLRQYGCCFFPNKDAMNLTKSDLLRFEFKDANNADVKMGLWFTNSLSKGTNQLDLLCKVLNTASGNDYTMSFFRFCFSVTAGEFLDSSDDKDMSCLCGNHQCGCINPYHWCMETRAANISRVVCPGGKFCLHQRKCITAGLSYSKCKDAVGAKPGEIRKKFQDFHDALEDAVRNDRKLKFKLDKNKLSNDDYWKLINAKGSKVRAAVLELQKFSDTLHRDPVETNSESSDNSNNNNNTSTSSRGDDDHLLQQDSARTNNNNSESPAKYTGLHHRPSFLDINGDVIPRKNPPNFTNQCSFREVLKTLVKSDLEQYTWIFNIHRGFSLNVIIDNKDYSITAFSWKERMIMYDIFEKVSAKWSNFQSAQMNAGNVIYSLLDGFSEDDERYLEIARSLFWKLPGNVRSQQVLFYILFDRWFDTHWWYDLSMAGFGEISHRHHHPGHNVPSDLIFESRAGNGSRRGCGTTPGLCQHWPRCGATGLLRLYAPLSPSFALPDALRQSYTYDDFAKLDVKFTKASAEAQFIKDQRSHCEKIVSGVKTRLPHRVAPGIPCNPDRVLTEEFKEKFKGLFFGPPKTTRESKQGKQAREERERNLDILRYGIISNARSTGMQQVIWPDVIIQIYFRFFRDRNDIADSAEQMNTRLHPNMNSLAFPSAECEEFCENMDPFSTECIEYVRDLFEEEAMYSRKLPLMRADPIWMEEQRIIHPQFGDEIVRRYLNNCVGSVVRKRLVNTFVVVGHLKELLGVEKTNNGKSELFTTSSLPKVQYVIAALLNFTLVEKHPSLNDAKARGNLNSFFYFHKIIQEKLDEFPLTWKSGAVPPGYHAAFSRTICIIPEELRKDYHEYKAAPPRRVLEGNLFYDANKEFSEKLVKETIAAGKKDYSVKKIIAEKRRLNKSFEENLPFLVAGNIIAKTISDECYAERRAFILSNVDQKQLVVQRGPNKGQARAVQLSNLKNSAISNIRAKIKRQTNIQLQRKFCDPLSLSLIETEYPGEEDETVSDDDAI